MLIKKFYQTSCLEKYKYCGVLAVVIMAMTSCEKLVLIDPPIDTITTTQVFSSEANAKSAMAGIYTSMANGDRGGGIFDSYFSTGLTTVLGELSSDELNVFNNKIGEFYDFDINKVRRENKKSENLWNSLYNTIYGTNALIEGIEASTSAKLQEKTRKELTGEARFLRAICYFYLVNSFGDVPLVLTVDFNKTRQLPKAPKEKVYKQIIDDLLFAQSVLPADFSAGNEERIIPNTWAATALLARVYLYTGDNISAAIQSSAVINNAEQFELIDDIKKVFLKESREAIWQLKSNTTIKGTGNATIEGKALIPSTNPGGPQFSYMEYNLSDQLLNAFEPGDKRRVEWVGTAAPNASNIPGVHYFPYKYKTGFHNRVVGGIASEYYMVLRLAEQHLIRAEAIANGSGGDAKTAIDDLNKIRHRANLTDLPYTLTKPQLITAIAHERRIEFFIEWGHRWFDLKRTGEASRVLSTIPLNKPWLGDYQLLYPIPPLEIQFDKNLIQNLGY